MDSKLSTGRAANDFIHGMEHVLTDANRLYIHEPATRSAAIAEHNAIIDQLKRLTNMARGWKHEVTGRF